MHKTATKGICTVTFTDDEWLALSVGFEKLMRMAKYRVKDGGDAQTFSPSIDIASELVMQADSLTGVDDWCDKFNRVTRDDTQQVDQSRD